VWNKLWKFVVGREQRPENRDQGAGIRNQGAGIRDLEKGWIYFNKPSTSSFSFGKLLIKILQMSSSDILS
jgi:hypothetical protein